MAAAYILLNMDAAVQQDIALAIGLGADPPYREELVEEIKEQR